MKAEAAVKAVFFRYSSLLCSSIQTAKNAPLIGALCDLFHSIGFHREDSFEGHEKTFQIDLRKIRANQLGGAEQLLLVVVCFPHMISAKGREPAISRAVGVAHEENATSAMQQDRHPHLLKNKVALKIVTGRSQRLGTPSHHNHVRTQNAPPLQKFIHCQPDPLVETAKHSRIGHIRLG